jgi:dsRNA-specific ribonuclease
MKNETGVQAPSLHTLIPLEDFKALLSLDDREDALSRFCLITASYTIEQYCKRRLLLKRHFERIEFHGDLILPLGEYPVREMLAAYTLYDFAGPGGAA